MVLTKVAVVTGANKGIGYAITKGLCENFDGIVYLTSRDVQRGEEAVTKLKKLNLLPKYYQLDITDENSVENFKKYISDVHGGIDVLVNNAGIRYPINSTEKVGARAYHTITVNYYGTLRMCTSLLPLLRANARVVNVSSSCGHLARIPSKDLRKKFGNPNVTIDALNKLLEEYMRVAQNEEHETYEWGKCEYVISKVGITALTKILQRKFDTENPSRNIQINAVHPGFVDTDMSEHLGTLTIAEGAIAPLFLALDDHTLKGEYVWCDKTTYDWYSDVPPPFFR